MPPIRSARVPLIPPLALLVVLRRRRSCRTRRLLVSCLLVSRAHLQRRRLRLLGHILRSPHHDLARSLTFHPSGRLRSLSVVKKRGKPRHNWALMTLIESHIRHHALSAYTHATGRPPTKADRPLLLPPPPSASHLTPYVHDSLGLRKHSLYRTALHRARDKYAWNRASV